jgi:hypothetical protein
MVADSPGGTQTGDVLDFNTRNGLVATGPATLLGVAGHPAPPAPGPKLHPHQLFVALTVACLLNNPLPVVALLDTIRVRLNVATLVPTGNDRPAPRSAPPETRL